MREQGQVSKSRYPLDRLHDWHQIPPEHRLASGEDHDEGVEALYHIGEVGHFIAIGNFPVIAKVATGVATLGDFQRHGHRPAIHSHIQKLCGSANLLHRTEGNLHRGFSIRSNPSMGPRRCLTIGAITFGPRAAQREGQKGVQQLWPATLIEPRGMLWCSPGFRRGKETRRRKADTPWPPGARGYSRHAKASVALDC